MSPATALAKPISGMAPTRVEEERDDRPRIKHISNEPRKKRLTTLKKRILAVSAVVGSQSLSFGG